MNQPGKTTPRSRRGTSGLTLLEVLAAAMIFAIVMTVLIGTSSETVQRAGVTKRRLEANLWADELVAGLELQMKERARPSFEQETLNDPFLARIEDSQPLLEGATPSDGALLTGSAAVVPAPIREHTWQYDVAVEWSEPDGPRTIERRTYFFDWAAAAEQYPDLVPAAGAEQAGLDPDQEPELELPE